MPTYLCHGFRWQRPNITIHVILQNLEDASPDWIIPPGSSQCILESFYSSYDFLPFCVPPPRSSASLSSRGSTRRGYDNSEDESQYSSSRPGTQSNARDDHGRRSRSRTPSQHVPDSSTAHGLPLPVPAPPPHTPGQDNPSPNNRTDEVQSQDWSVVKLLEEYDPTNMSEVSRPYAYVADHVVRVDLSVSIFDEIAKYEERVRSYSDGNPAMVGPSDEKMPAGVAAAKPKKSSAGKKQAAAAAGTGWFEKLRDQVQADEEIRWYVVVNGDEVRDYPAAGTSGGGEELEEEAQRQGQLGDGPRERVREHMPKGRERIDGHGMIVGQETMLVPERLRKGAGGKPISAKASVESEAPRPKLKPKASSKSGFRRLFGRSKTDGGSQ